MAAEPTQFERVRVGRDHEIGIRPIRPEDKEAIAEGFARLSPRSRYRRFFAPLERLTAQDLRYLTEIDHDDHEALIAFDASSGDPVAVARFVRGAEAGEAELSVVVIDDWQRRGVASALLTRLVERARESGIDHFVALVLDENSEAVELAERLSPAGVPRRRSASGNVELLIPLPSPGQMRSSSLGGALRAAASGALHANPWRVMRDAIRRRSG